MSASWSAAQVRTSWPSSSAAATAARKAALPRASIMATSSAAPTPRRAASQSDGCRSTRRRCDTNRFSGSPPPAACMLRSECRKYAVAKSAEPLKNGRLTVCPAPGRWPLSNALAARCATWSGNAITTSLATPSLLARAACCEFSTAMTTLSVRSTSRFAKSMADCGRSCRSVAMDGPEPGANRIAGSTRSRGSVNSAHSAHSAHSAPRSTSPFQNGRSSRIPGAVRSTSILPFALRA